MQREIIVKTSIPMKSGEDISGFADRMRNAVKVEFGIRRPGSTEKSGAHTVAIYSDKVVFEHCDDIDGEYRMVGYSVDENGEFKFAGSPVKVRRQVSYVPMDDSSMTAVKVQDFEGTGFWQGVPITKCHLL